MNFEKYKNIDPYPNYPHKPHLKDKNCPDKLREYAVELEKYKLAEAEFKKQKAIWHKKDGELQQQFKMDAFIELGIVDNPKANLLYSKAWEHGHANGLSEVWYYLQDLVELISY